MEDVKPPGSFRRLRDAVTSLNLRQIVKSQFLKQRRAIAMKRKLMLPSLLALALFLGAARSAMASTTWYVNGVKGNNSYNCKSPASACKTIGHAISHSSSGDSIIVAPATYKENLSIAFTLTITGSPTPTTPTIIDGGGSTKKATVVTIKSTAHVTLADLTLQNGFDLTTGGGGIHNAGTLMIVNTTVSGNSSYDSGAPAGGLGGGIYNAGTGTLTVLQSTISGNTATRSRPGANGAGGGIYNAGRLTITNSTLSWNQAADNYPAMAAYGGGIANESGSSTMINMINNSTISQNEALIKTPVGNGATYGGGIYNKSGTALTVQNSILANNSNGGNCYGSLTSHGYNMSSDGTCTKSLHDSGDRNNTNPNLGPLRNNGGPTKTMALLSPSPAMNAGNPSGCTDSSGKRLLIDQRNLKRPDPGACDMGAYNHQP
jgi:hypothetical protein